MLGGFSAVSWLSYQRARALMDRQITTSTLPLTSDAIISSLEHDLLQPVLASGLMGIIGTFVILKVIDSAVGLRVTQEEELIGLDVSQHGEEGYIFV